MIMLQRASEGEDKDLCEMCLATGIGADKCEAVCGNEDNGEEDNGDGVVKSWDLAVTSTPASERKAIINAISDLDTLTFKTSEEVTISKVVLERYGYSKAGDVDKVWLEDEDGNEITARKSVNSRDEVELTFKKDYKVVDGAINATIVVKLNSAVTTGGTIWFKVVSAESTAENQELDKSGYTPYTYDMVGYDAVSVTVEPKGNDKDYNYEEGEFYEVAKVKLKSATSPLTVNGLVLTNGYAGTKLDLKDFLKDVEVTVNGEKVSGVKFTIKNKNELNITFDEVEVAAKSNATFAVSIALEWFDKYGQWVQFWLAETSDMKITEKKTGARVSITAKPAQALYASHKFVGSKIKLTNTKLWNVEYAKGSSDVVVAEGTIAISEPVELLDNQYQVDVVYSTWFDNIWIIEEMKMVIAGVEFDADKTYTANATGATFKFKDVTIEKGWKFQIKVDLNRDAPDSATVTFSGSFDDVAFSGATYPDADDSTVSSDEIAGVINFASKLTVQASKASLSSTLTQEKEFKDNGTDENVVFEWTYTAKKGTISLTDFEIAALDNTLTLWNSTINFYLYLNGSKNYSADVRLKGTTITGSDSFAGVEVAAGESIDVKVVAEVTAKNLGALDLGKFKITLRGEDEDSNPAGEASKNTVSMKVVTQGSVVLGEANSSKENTVLRRGTDAVLADFNVEPDGASKADLETLVFTISGATLATIDDLDVEIDNKSIRDENCKLATGASGLNTITCADFSETIPSEGANIKVSLTDADSVTWKVVLTVTTINTDTTVNKVFKKSFVDVLVTFTKQDFGKVSTEFTIDVDKYKSSNTVKDLKLYTMSGTTCSKLVAPAWATVTLADPSKGKSFTITNGAKNQEICKVVYTVATADDTEITKEEYPDYFKKIPTVGSDRAEDLLVYNDGSN